MKLVTEYLTAGEASLAASSLEAAGIATYVSNSESARLPVASRHAGGVGLWVVIDDQLWDAKQLLENPEHQVESRLTEAQQKEIHESISNTGMSGALGILLKLLGMTILLVIAVYAITRL